MFVFYFYYELWHDLMFPAELNEMFPSLWLRCTLTPFKRFFVLFYRVRWASQDPRETRTLCPKSITSPARSRDDSLNQVVWCFIMSRSWILWDQLDLLGHMVSQCHPGFAMHRHSDLPLHPTTLYWKHYSHKDVVLWSLCWTEWAGICCLIGEVLCPDFGCLVLWIMILFY